LGIFFILFVYLFFSLGSYCTVSHCNNK